MERFFLILMALIWVEVTILLFRSRQKANIFERKRKLYLDTSALMDARLKAFLQTGVANYEIVILRSVLHELQLLADGADSNRRVRARAGLEMASELREIKEINVTIFDDPRDPIGVDNRLLEFAKQNNGAILTNDFNLKMLAEAERLQAISLNEIALILRSEHAPGDVVKVQVTAAGSGANQGIGYLDDGTMVVIDQAKKQIGKKIEIILTRINQANSGTIFFAKINNKKENDKAQKQKNNNVRVQSQKAKVIAKVEAKKIKADKKATRRHKMTAEEKLIKAAENQK